MCLSGLIYSGVLFLVGRGRRVGVGGGGGERESHLPPSSPSSPVFLSSTPALSLTFLYKYRKCMLEDSVQFSTVRHNRYRHVACLPVLFDPYESTRGCVEGPGTLDMKTHLWVFFVLLTDSLTPRHHAGVSQLLDRQSLRAAELPSC